MNTIQIIGCIGSFLSGVLISYYIGKYYPKITVKNYHDLFMKSKEVFDENTYFIEPTDVKEAFTKSTNVADFVKNIKK